MTTRCPACGHEFTGAACPRCGRPLDPPANATGPVSSPTADTTNVVRAEPGIPAATTRRRIPVGLVVGIAVLALALVAGGAYAAIRIAAPGVLPTLPGTGPVELSVTGTPPSVQPWRAGYQESWRVSPARVVSRIVEGESQGNPYAYAARGKSLVLFTVDTTTASGTVLAVDQANGRRVWDAGSGEQCSGIVNDAALRCQGGRMGYYPTELVNLSTGKSAETPSSQELGARIPDGEEDGYRWTTFVVDGVLFAGWLDRSTADAESTPLLNVARLTDDGTRFVWTSEHPLAGQTLVDDNLSTPGRVTHGVLTARWGALDAATGKVVLDGSGSDQPAAVQWVAKDVLQGGDQTSQPRQVTAPDGTGVSVIGVGGISVTTEQLPKHPLRQTSDGVAAFDPSTGADSLTGPTLWSTKLGAADEGDSILDDGTNGSYLLAYHDGLIALARQPRDSRSGLVSLLSEDTGAVLWQSSITVPPGGDERGVVVPMFTPSGNVIVQASQSHLTVESGSDESELTMFDTASGDILWTRAGAIGGGRLDALNTAPFAPDVEERDGIVVDNLDGRFTYSRNEAGSFSMLRPRTASSATTPPAGAPACPSGMTAISWTQYADGAILLCRADQRYAVVYPAHLDWQATRLDFSGGGYAITFSNGTSVRTSLGGALVYTSSGGTVSAQPATASWSSATGVVKLGVPSDLETCPAGSWPISLSTYDGGWLLVCGTAAGAPTAMFLRGDSGVVDVGSVVGRRGGYCGTADVGTVCAYRSPAVVSVTDPSGKVTQHSADANYFDDHGQGGTGKGNGSYGVDTPDDNGKDQVRYLTQILEKSMAGRTNLQAAVDKVRGCTDVVGAVASFNDVLANRQELLDALDSAPVDAVPNGSALVASLRNALRLSHDSDEVWLQWAMAEQANGCADGEDNPLYQQVRTMNNSVAAAKSDFLAVWNRDIAPTYGARRFKTSQI